MRQLLCVIGLAFGLCAGVFAGDFEDASAAYNRGDYATALAKIRVLAAQGKAFAQYNLGVMYAHGQGVVQDYQQAAYWYGKAAEQGDASSQLTLGVMYEDGQGVPQDFQWAAYWYNRAADQGRADAQNNLGNMYNEGKGVAQDFKLGAYWYGKAAEQGDASAQNNLGAQYAEGNGVVQDYVQAHKWLNLAASQGVDLAKNNRVKIEKRMTAQQIAEAQRLAREWKPQPVVAQRTAPESAAPEWSPPLHTAPAPPELVSSGTGFFISAAGHVLTNAHVINECSSLTVESIGKPAEKAVLVASDTKNDLAVIQTNGRATRAAAFRAGGVRQGESVVAYGFPLSGAIASTGNVTTGNVSALAGFHDDSRMLQISAPVQPGNSGGALMDMTGAVVGVVVGKLNAAKFMEVTGDIPQNVNFAIKAHVAKGFLESHGVEYETAPKAKGLSVADVADAARAFSVRVLCYR